MQWNCNESSIGSQIEGSTARTQIGVRWRGALNCGLRGAGLARVENVPWTRAVLATYVHVHADVTFGALIPPNTRISTFTAVLFELRSVG